jgi:hypothetical protein
MNRSFLIALVAGLVFAALGIVLWRWPADIQRWLLAKYQVWTGVAGWNPMLKFVQSDSYITALRFVAVISMIAALIAFWTAMRR